MTSTAPEAECGKTFFTLLDIRHTADVPAGTSPDTSENVRPPGY